MTLVILDPLSLGHFYLAGLSYSHLLPFQTYFSGTYCIKIMKHSRVKATKTATTENREKEKS